MKKVLILGAGIASAVAANASLLSSDFIPTTDLEPVKWDNSGRPIEVREEKFKTIEINGADYGMMESFNYPVSYQDPIYLPRHNRRRTYKNH